MAVIKMKNGDKWEYVSCVGSQAQSGVPEFTESDNGKVLTIVDGVMTWAEATGGSGSGESVPSAEGVEF